MPPEFDGPLTDLPPFPSEQEFDGPPDYLPPPLPPEFGGPSTDLPPELPKTTEN